MYHTLSRYSPPSDFPIVVILNLIQDLWLKQRELAEGPRDQMTILVRFWLNRCCSGLVADCHVTTFPAMTGVSN